MDCETSLYSDNRFPSVQDAEKEDNEQNESLRKQAGKKECIVKVKCLARLVNESCLC